MAERPVALVTGGARRIGAAIASDLAKNGFSVALHARSLNDAEAAAAEIAASGGDAAGFAADLTDMDDVAALVKSVSERLGPVALLVNNASLFIDDSAADFDWAQWDAHFAVHLKAPALLARDMAAALPAARDGLIVNIIDQRVERLNPRFFSYTLSKSALWTATRTMAQAFAPRIRVNAIGPGPTLANERQKEEDFAAQLDGLLLKRGPALDEFGATIRWLWSARSVTGQLIQLDGGQHLAWETPDIAGIVE
ncbi:MAG: SDR family oxidoreductase [Phyllobacteriaceae bacterium]|nr:SDR family oxidoreductase [Phyllobacteriaceae bacterium]